MNYGTAASSCGAYSRGETEDYTVVIGAAFARQGSFCNPKLIITA